MTQEITAQELNADNFTNEKVKEIRKVVGDEMTINALSGGIDSSTVTMLGHRALGKRLKTLFIENGLMPEGEPEQVVDFFRKLDVTVEVVDARKEFFGALKGITDPEEKRGAITQTFYRNVFGRIVKESRVKYLLQGTILTDVDETVAGIKRQHNFFEQLGINPQEAFGYRIIEPLIQLRKDGVRKMGKALGLPSDLFERTPFPGPALAARVIGKVTSERIETVRKATVVVERLLKGTGAFQYMAILHEDRLTANAISVSRSRCDVGTVSTIGLQHPRSSLIKSLSNLPAKSSGRCLASSASHTIFRQNLPQRSKQSEEI